MAYYMLDNTVRFPAAVRPQVKALIVKASGFDVFEAANGPSRSYTKEQWIAAAHHCGVARDVLDIVNAYLANPTAPATADETGDDDDMTDAATLPAPTGATFDPDAILGPIGNFLAPAILTDLRHRLAPVIDAANKPAKVITQQITVTPTPTGEAVPYARRVGEIEIGKAFGAGAEQRKFGKIKMGVWDAQDAPNPDALFVPDFSVLAPVVSSMERGENVWLFGPAGTGKTTQAMQIAAIAKRPFVRIAFNRAVEPIDLFGAEGLDGKGGMEWRDGSLTKAIRRPGTVILLDEPTFAPPGSLASLQTLLDHRFVTLSNGQTVRCAEGVAFIAADNTAGAGDSSGVYAGTQTMNAALSDRFARLVSVNYMEPEQEAQALANHTSAPLAACARVVAFLGAIRKAQAADGTGRPMSLRQAIAFIRASQDGFGPNEACEMVFLNRLPDAERETVRQLWRTQFETSLFALEMSGKAAPSDAPEQVRAREAFSAA